MGDVMKKFIPLIAIAALAACQAEEPAVEEEAVEEAPAMSIAPPAGSYQTVWEDGTTYDVVVGEGGSITQTSADGEVMSGMFVAGEEGKRCIDYGGEQGVICATESEPAEDGSWTVTGDDGGSFTVTPVVEEEAAAE